jgi:hypothetical protein
VPGRHPQNNTQWKWKIEENRGLELSNAADEHGQAEDDTANFLDDGHG